MCKSVNIFVFWSYQCCPGALKQNCVFWFSSHAYKGNTDFTNVSWKSFILQVVSPCQAFHSGIHFPWSVFQSLDQPPLVGSKFVAWASGPLSFQGAG